MQPAKKLVRIYALAALTVAACRPVVRFTATGDPPQRAPKNPRDVKLYFDLDEPKCHYRIVGFVEAESAISNEDIYSPQVEPLRDEVAKRGFDGLVGVRCASPGTVTSASGACSGRAYVCE